MKKAISLILAIVMTAAMLPGAAFAAEGDTTGITIKYDIVSPLSSYSNATKLTNDIITASYTKEATKEFYTCFELNGVNLRKRAECIQIQGTEYIAFKIYVPKAGTYDMHIYNGELCNVYKDGCEGAGECYYIGTDTDMVHELRYTGKKTKVYISQDSVQTSSDYHKITYDSYVDYAETVFAATTTPKVIEKAIVATEPGYYIVTFQGSGGSYATAGNFTLTSGPNNALIGGTLTAGDSELDLDAGDKEIVEAGIIFGQDATINSCTEKFTSQKNADHGQFTADGEGDARGYIIYKDGGDYIVKYSD